MRKEQALQHWASLAPTDPLPLMEVIPYKSSGSSYGACGIRIDGTPAFIDAVLSQLKSILDGENCITRLELSRQAVKPRDGRELLKACDNAEVCYVRLHERGGQGKVASWAFDRALRPAAERFATARGQKIG